MTLVLAEAEVLFDFCPKRCAQERAAVVPAPLMHVSRYHTKSGQCLAEAERVDDPGGIRRQIDAATNFAQSARLLVDVRVNSEFAQAKCGREPTNTAAYDGNGSSILVHKRLPNEIREKVIPPVRIPSVSFHTLNTSTTETPNRNSASRLKACFPASAQPWQFYKCHLELLGG